MLLSSVAAICLWGFASGDRVIRASPVGQTGRTYGQVETPAPQPTSNPPSLEAPAQTPWQLFSRPEGGFAVQMPPGTVREGVQPMETELGAIDIHLLGIDLPTRLYAIVYQDFPEAFEAATPEALLSSTLEGVKGNVSRRLQDDRAITLGNHPGVDLYYEGFDGLSYKQRLYVVNRRMYMLVAATSEAVSSSFIEDADRFFNSFELNPNAP